MGAQVVELPTIAIQPRPDAELDAAIEKLAGCHWAIFTSANTVQVFLERARKTDRLSDLLDTIEPRICAIGPATGRMVNQYGLTVDLIPSVYQAEGVLEDFLAYHQGTLEGLRILLPRASRAREILPETLRNKGAVVEVIPIYDTVIPEESRNRLQEILTSDPPDMITLTSSSTVTNLVQLSGESASLLKFRYAAIGPITAETARDHELSVVVQASQSTIPGLAVSIQEYFQSQGQT